MKPNRIAAEKERKAKMRLRRMARSIPDNATLTRIVMSFPERPFRADFYRRIAPNLKFKPLPLEVIENA